MKQETPSRLLKLSIPVKVVLITGVVYAFFWISTTYLTIRGVVDFSIPFLGLQLQYWFWIVQVLILALTATLSSSFLLDRPLKRLQRVMKHVEDGHLLVRAPKETSDELAELSDEFNRMLDRLSDLSVEQVRAEHDETVEGQRAEIAETHRTFENVVQDLSILYEIGQQVASITDLDTLYERITRTLRKYLSVEEFAVMIYNEQRDELRVRAASGFTNDDEALKVVLKKGEGISGVAAETGKKIYVRDTRTDSRFLHYKGHRLSLSLSFLSVPLIYKGEVLGVINFGRPQVGGFTAADVKMYSLVANQLALAIANAKLYTKTRELSVKDELTGIYNRRHLQQMLNMEWKRAVRFRRDLSLVMIDVDHFKRYNDTHGHLQGDAVLKRLGQLLLENLREVDTVARFGGEEFVLLLPDTDKRGAIVVAEKVRKLVEQQLQTTISAGLATFPDDVAEMEDLIDHADIALYRAKEAGRNRVMCYADPNVEATEEAIAEAGEQEKKKFISTLQ